MSMFCYQCEQTAKGVACTKKGVCGKDDRVAALQDNLVQGVKAISAYAHRAREHGGVDAQVDAFVPWALFTTLTNVNFDVEDFRKFIARAAEMRDRARELYRSAVPGTDEASDGIVFASEWQPAGSLDELVQQGREVGIDARIEKYGKDVTGLQETIVYGLKGAGAYLHHAHLLGEDDEGVYGQFHEIVDFVAGEPTDADDLLGYALKTGELNLLAMELLDRANTGTYGDPEPTEVRVTPVKGKSIVVSGHDLKDLEELLKQTQGEGINVYTHGEMLPCNAYPQLKKYDHLVGNYGGAWQEQQKEFADFPGAILMTTNCLMEPKDSYRDRIFTCGPVGWPGVTHIDGHDFSPVIDAALSQPGFQEDAPEKTITIGFGHNAVMGVADKVIDAVKAGDIRHFFLIGGCDGARPGRNYYTKLAEQVPEDCVILTLACGKYRFNKLEFGDIGGIPRLLDVGQCNDAYSAVKIAQALADAFDTDVNGLPLSLVLSWYEQKAVAILLTLFYLGIRDMRLGPTLPAFIEPAVLDVLVDKFQISPISTPEEDLQAILG